MLTDTSKRKQKWTKPHEKATSHAQKTSKTATVRRAGGQKTSDPFRFRTKLCLLIVDYKTAKETHKTMGDMERRLLEELQTIRKEMSNRVGMLEKWKWVIVGGSIVAGFIIQKLITVNL